MLINISKEVKKGIIAILHTLSENKVRQGTLNLYYEVIIMLLLDNDENVIRRKLGTDTTEEQRHKYS